eukprot:scaffold9354_cov108-Isochrysis_galbana.AAC.10
MRRYLLLLRLAVLECRAVSLRAMLCQAQGRTLCSPSRCIPRSPSRDLLLGHSYHVHITPAFGRCTTGDLGKGRALTLCSGCMVTRHVDIPTRCGRSYRGGRARRSATLRARQPRRRGDAATRGRILLHRPARRDMVPPAPEHTAPPAAPAARSPSLAAGRRPAGACSLSGRHLATHALRLRPTSPALPPRQRDSTALFGLARNPILILPILVCRSLFHRSLFRRLLVRRLLVCLTRGMLSSSVRHSIVDKFRRPASGARAATGSVAAYWVGRSPVVRLQACNKCPALAFAARLARRQQFGLESAMRRGRPRAERRQPGELL